VTKGKGEKSLEEGVDGKLIRKKVTKFFRRMEHIAKGGGVA